MEILHQRSLWLACPLPPGSPATHEGGFPLDNRLTNLAADPEHSIVFSLCTLIWCAIAAIALAAWSARRGKPLRAFLAVVLKAPSSRFLSLVGFVVGRTLLLDTALDNAHCSIEGIYVSFCSRVMRDNYL